MKITLSLEEINQLVWSHYQLPNGTKVEIIGQESESVAEKLTNALTHAGCLTFAGLHVLPSQKIKAIKIIRDHIIDGRDSNDSGRICGLRNAKRAAEDWHNFISYVSRTGHFPNMSGDIEANWVS